MKRIVSIAIALAALTLVGCQTVDLSPLEKRVSDLESIVHNLQEISLTGDYVTDIQPFTENGKIVGYQVTFNEHGTVTVRNGKDGAPGDPGDPGDPGAPGEDGEDGDQWFADVTVSDDTVTFKLDDANHTTFTIPRAGAAADFGLIIENRQPTVSTGGQTLNVPYTLKGGDDQTVVSVMATEGYTAKVADGKIIITAPEEPGDAQIWVVAENGAGKSSVVVLRVSYQEAQIITPDKSKWNSTTSDNAITIDLGGESSFDAIIFAQSGELKGSTIPSKFTLEASLDGENWSEVVANQPLIGRPGSQTKDLGKVRNAQKIRITFPECFEAELPVKLPEVDLGLQGDRTGAEVAMAEVPVLQNAQSPFETDGVGHFSVTGMRHQALIGWNHTQSTWGITCDTAADEGAGKPCIFAAAAWGCTDIANGKVYQTLTFEPGYYSFDATIFGADDPYDVDVFTFVAKGEGGADGANLPSLNAEGNFVPNDNTLNSLKVDEIDGHSEAVVSSLVFKVEEPGPITVGYVGNTYSGQHVANDPVQGWIHVWGAFLFNGFAVSGK